MHRVVALVTKPKVQIAWWAFWTITWLILDPVTMLTPLSRSIPWLEEMSLFANFASCGTALVAAFSYRSARSVDEKDLHSKLDHIIEHHPDIPCIPTAGVQGERIGTTRTHRPDKESR